MGASSRTNTGHRSARPSARRTSRRRARGRVHSRGAARALDDLCRRSRGFVVQVAAEDHRVCLPVPASTGWSPAAASTVSSAAQQAMASAVLR